MESSIPLDQLTLDATALYREETFTDLKVGTLRRLTPVTTDGSQDESRPVLYTGQAQLYTPAGPLPLAFEIPAASLKEALEKFAETAQQAIEQTMEELKELRRQAASQIVIPEAGGAGLGGAGGLGGMPGGRIKMP